MAYTKQTWQNGDIITDDKLNHMEDGIANAGGGGLLINLTDDTANSEYVMDKTWKEIHDVIASGGWCVIRLLTENADTYTPITSARAELGYEQYTVWDANDLAFSTSSEDGYPSYYYGD